MKKYLLALLYFSSIAVAHAQYQLVWSDEFSGNSLDTNYWSYQLGDGCPALCGWGNGELQSYTKEAATVSNGLLMIKAKKENIGNSTYSSARIRTINKFDFCGGRMVVRARLPIGKGYWPAAWFLPTENVYGGWPASGEIDLLEGKGQEPNKIYGTIHFGPYAPNNRYNGGSYTLSSGTFTDSFHDFEVIWKKDTIQWLVDGILYYQQTKQSLGYHRWPFDRNFHAILNLAVGGFFLGNPDASTPDTATFQIDYIRVYQIPEQAIITGQNDVFRKETAITYSAPSGYDSYEWILPIGATAQGNTNGQSIKLNWGVKSDTLKVKLGKGTATYNANKFVRVLPDSCSGRIDDVMGVRSFYWLGSTGNFTYGIQNPAKNDINPDMLVNRYYRSGGQQYDIINLGSDLIHHAADFENGTLVLKVKIYTTAPVGTEINLNFENRERAKLDYPSGRRCVLQAKTTVSRAWETLTFKLLMRPDLATPEGSIDQFILLFAPNSNTTDTYFMDDFEIEEKPCRDGVSGVLEEVLETLPIYPNPSNGELFIPERLQKLPFNIIALDGKLMANGTGSEALINEWKQVKPGVYLIQFNSGNRLLNYKLWKTE